jgi:tetratricopeptide (TPR) repeat protein
LVTDKETLQKAMQAIKDGKRELGLKLLVQVAESFAAKRNHENAARIFEKAGLLARDIYRLEECLELIEKATLMYMRQGAIDFHPEIVRLNVLAAEIADEATDYGKAADFYFRAVDYEEDEKKDTISLRAVDSLENLADNQEEEGLLKETIGLLKKISRLYYSLDDEELGARTNDRAIRVAQRWADDSREKNDFLEAGNALAEIAQIMQAKDEFVEAARLMMEAGEYYEGVNLYEKAGNIYDAAQEVYKFERLTSARNQAMMKAAEAYLKMEGSPEVVAPLLVKAGDMFTEANSPMKAKWAFKRANELFAELAKIATDESDIESEKTYLRYRAMCLKKWGSGEEADEIYNDVIAHYLNEAKKEETSENMELQALALESAASVLSEAGREEEAITHRERAVELYIQLADANAASGSPEESSRFYTKAADCAGSLGNLERKESFHWIASEKAEEAAKYYEELEVYELSTVWTRTAGKEALHINDQKTRDRATELLEKSAQGFKTVGEEIEAFEDLFTVYESIFTYKRKGNKRRLNRIVKDMDQISRSSRHEGMLATMAVLHSIQKDKYIAALLALQEREDELLDRRHRLRTLIKLGSEKYGAY